MTLVQCKACGNNVSRQARKCPQCGQPLPALKGPAAVAAIIVVPLAAVAVWFMLQGGINQKVANDSIDQYNIAKQQGNKIQICLSAGLVAAAFLQAKDDENYRIWMNTETSDCTAAGMPSP
jgi:hypothetical protein